MNAYTLLISYGLAGLSLLGTAALLVFSRARNPYKHLLLIAVSLSFAWALFFALSPWVPSLVTAGNIIEPARSLAWIAVVGLLLHRLGAAQADRTFLVLVLGVSTLCGVAIAAYWAFSTVIEIQAQGLAMQGVFTANLLVAVSGILLVENLYRNADTEAKWAIKHLCFGLAALFTYDFFMSAEAALFARVDQNLFLARGLVNALATLLIVVSAGRSKDWPIDIHVSRRVVFHTVTLLVGGAYLLVMALTGYAVGSVEAEWSGPLQVTFFAAAALVLIVVFSSGSVRAWGKQFISENFFSYKYDYRDEWLRFIDQVSAVDQSSTISERIVRAIASLVESTSGVLWVYRSDDDSYTPVARWNVSQALPSMEIGAPLPMLLSQDPKPIEISEERVELPEEIEKMKRAWLIVPLTHRQQLLAFLVLGAPRAPRKLDWEDKQLLSTAGSQAASYLAEDILAQDLLLARRFDDLNRRFAFVVHDIKNLTGQMSLLVENADKYGDNPDFQKDMLSTVRDGLGRMRRLLVKLKDGPDRFANDHSMIELTSFLTALSSEWKTLIPHVALEIPEEPLRVSGDEEALASAITHLVQNAIDAVDAEGSVSVILRREDEAVILTIRDDGPGMKSDFIRDHLFQPLDSTKKDGYGIGAYQVREIVKAMGGTLSVTSEVGLGTTFDMKFSVAGKKAPLKVFKAHD